MNWDGIKTATTEELVAELKARFDSIVMIGSTRQTDTHDQIHFEFSGGIAASLGLASYAVTRCQLEIAHGQTMFDDDEEGED